MSEVRKWLETIGLSQYADAFETNDLDIDLLRQVDDQLLKDIGVASAGHRLRIRNAIAKLEAKETADGSLTSSAPPRIAERQQSVSTLPPAPPLSISSVVEPKGERRYLTVMFCDLVGSTGISAQLDAEEWRDLVGAYLDAASAAVTEMGGHVAKKLGDGLDGAVRLSGRAGERCRTRSAGCALDPTRARRAEPQECRLLASRRSTRASALKPAR